MKSVLVSAAFAALVAAPAIAQPPTGTTTEGNVKVEEAVTPPVQAQSSTQVTVDTTVEETTTARVETTTEVIAPVSDRPALDATNPIAPEVQALVQSKPNYTTKDIVDAQLAAVLATPPAAPTTVITTTRTTPKEGG
jgi:hypothetical protein